LSQWEVTICYIYGQKVCHLAGMSLFTLTMAHDFVLSPIASDKISRKLPHCWCKWPSRPALIQTCGGLRHAPIQPSQLKAERGTSSRMWLDLLSYQFSVSCKEGLWSLEKAHIDSGLFTFTTLISHPLPSFGVHIPTIVFWCVHIYFLHIF